MLMRREIETSPRGTVEKSRLPKPSQRPPRMGSGRITRHAGSVLVLFAVALLVPATTAHGISEADRDPIDVLRQEHQIIREMAGAAETTAESIRTGDVDPERVARLLDFFRNFADRCHHAKEERELFPALREALEDRTALDLLVKQHEEGRILLQGIEGRLAATVKGGTPADREALARYLDEYAHLMDRHIDLENGFLWPLASQALDAAEKERLAQAFHRIEVQDLGEGFHEKYHAMAKEILGHQAE